MGKRPVAILLTLLCCRLALWAEESDPLQLSAKPGVYRQDVALVVGTDAGYTAVYRFAGSAVFLPLPPSLALGAIDGETRDYRLQLEIRRAGQAVGQRDLLYTIDKTAPGAPEPDTAPGTWFGPIQPGFILAGAEAGDRIMCSWTASDGTSQTAQEGALVRLEGRSGSLVSYRLTVFAEDAVRHAGPALTWNYTIDRRRERVLKEIPVYSPVEGRFRNHQYFYLDYQPFAEVRYSLDGSDPRKGPAYSGGFLIEQTGRVNLRVWARTQSGAELERSIVYEAGAERLPELESGVVGQPRVVQISREIFRYAAGERQPGPDDSSLATPLRVSPQTGALRGVALRLLRERDQANFRYYLVLDGRQPQAPEVWARTVSSVSGAPETIQGQAAVHQRLDLTVRASDGSRVWYRLDGVNPEANPAESLPADGALSIPVAQLAAKAGPDGLVGLVFQARQADGAWGPATSLVVNAGKAPAAPELRLRANPDGSASLLPGAWQGSLWYRIASDFHAAAHGGPFRLDGPAQLVLPAGAASTVRLSWFGVDASGRASPVSELPAFSLANLVPLEPAISLSKDSTVTLSGPGSLRYRVLADNAAAPSAIGAAAVYQKPFVLKPLAGANVAYQIEAWSEDASGRVSSVARYGPVHLHDRAPAAPSIAEGGVELYRNSRVFNLAVNHPEAGMRYRYSLGKPGAVADPGNDSPWTATEIPVRRDEADIDLEIRVQAVSSVRPDLVSPIIRITVHIMTTAPAAPEIRGVVQGGLYNRALEIGLSPPKAGQLSYRLAAGAIDSQAPWQDYRSPLRIPAPPDSDQTYQLQARFQDRAGNLSPAQAALSFRVLTKAPALVPPTFTASDGTAARPAADGGLLSRLELRFSAQPGEGLRISYVLDADAGSAGLTMAGARSMEGEVPIGAAEGTEKTWRLQYRVLDGAGNASPASPVYVLTIDRKAPAAPPPPDMDRQGNTGSLSWIKTDDAILEYFISPIAAPTGELEYRIYGGERVPWSLGGAADRLFVFYRSRDAAGNLSDVQTLSIAFKRQAPLPRIEGIVEGGLYRELVVARLADPDPAALVRYELSAGDQEAIEAGGQSALLPPMLEIGPLAGETVRYRLSVRQFVDGLEPSPALDLDFTIDRTLPRTPQIPGAGVVTYSAESLDVRLEADPADQVWYCLRQDALPQSGEQMALDAAGEQDFRAQAAFVPSGGEVLRLPLKAGQVSRYLLLAYSQDAAGNRSASTPLWQFFVDGDSVYLADPLTAGSAWPDAGTRDRPFHDVAAAVRYASENGKTSLRLAGGRYPLASTLTVPAGLRITGGYHPEKWTAGTEATIIYPKSGFAGKVLIRAPAGVSLGKLVLADGGNGLESMVQAEGGRTELDGCNVAVTQTLHALTAVEAEVSIRNSSLSCNDPAGGELLALDRSQCRIQASVLESADLPAVLLKNQARAAYSLIRSTDSAVEVDDSLVRPRRGQDTTAVRLRGGSFQMRRGLLSAGIGQLSACAVDAAEGTRISLLDTACRTEPGAGNTVLFRIGRAELSMRGGGLELAGAAGVYGILAEAGTVQLNGVELHGGRAADFLTIFSMKGTKLQVSDCHLSGSESSDFRIASLSGGDSVWNGNGIQVAGGSGATGLFFLTQGGRHEFTGNTFVGNDQHTLFYLGSPEGSLTVRSNILEHWRFILQEGTEAYARHSDQDKGFNSLQQLESSRRQGSLFEGNKVRQGL
jgi:hypothetical protein